MLLGRFYLHIDKLAGAAFAFGHEHVHRVAPRVAALPEVLAFLLMAGAFEEHIGLKAHAGAEPCFGTVVLQALQAFEAGKCRNDKRSIVLLHLYIR